MSRSSEEKNLLAKLASGILDGMAGDERVYGVHKHVYCGKYIKGWEPIPYRQGESERFFNGRENDVYSARLDQLSRPIRSPETLKLISCHGVLINCIRQP